MMGHFGEALRKLRCEAHLTQAELAKRLGLSASSIGMYEQGQRKPSYEVLEAVADEFNVNLDLLVDRGDTGTVQPRDALDVIRQELFDVDFVSKYSRLDSFGKNTVRGVLDFEYERCVSDDRAWAQPYRPINLMTLPVSAGTGIALPDDESAEPIYIPLDSVSKRADFVLEVHGNSMEPAYKDRDLILVRKADVIDKGQLGIFAVNGEGYFKKLGHNQLISLNSDYAPIELKPDDNVTCFGRVLGRTKQIYPND